MVLHIVSFALKRGRRRKGKRLKGQKGGLHQARLCRHSVLGKHRKL